VFFIWNFSEVDKTVIHIFFTFLIGFIYDLGTVSLFVIPHAIYLLIVPKKLYGSILDKVMIHSIYSLSLFIILFSFLSEITFWDEFKSRFNFIAVDYLVYTSEVLKNINESYPLPILIGSILVLVFILILIPKRQQLFKAVFNDNTTTFKKRALNTLPIVLIAVIFALFIPNQSAEQFKNRYNNELAKSGIYSFFAAFRNNELSYTEFYNTLDSQKAFTLVENRFLKTKDSLIQPEKLGILRNIKKADTSATLKKPNVIFICMESLGSKRLEYFGSSRNITPNLDALIDQSVFFTNLFATGTRTVRGMEAITLSIPPTPGRSIIKRKNNSNLFTVNDIFKNKGYTSSFFYGGDGYFDNMDTYFGGNGFKIVDRGSKFLLNDEIKTERINIEDSEVTFENAWGVCDEDIFSKVLKEADKSFDENTLFFDFVMTTSNHRPYTYPEGKVKIPSGQERDGAIQYADYSIGKFLEIAKEKPWFDNTVFIIMSDHCAASSGRWELDVKNYHIPAYIYNLPNQKPIKITKQCSQIDIFPTLFALLNWDYTSNLFGVNILEMQPEDERAFIGNYRKLGLLKKDSLMVLGDQKTTTQYKWNKETNELLPQPINLSFLEETTAYYQVADYLYHHEGLKSRN